MAIIELGPTVTGIRGTIGGITFSANANGPYIRQWKKPSVPRTDPVLASRDIMSQFPQAWSALTPTERAQFATVAAQANRQRTNSLGQVYNMSAYDLFVAVNYQRLLMGFAIGNFTTGSNFPAAPTGLTLVAAAPSQLDVSWSSPTYANPEVISFYCAISGFAVRNVPPNRWRWMTTITAGASGAAIDLEPFYTAAFGPLITGTRIWVKAYAFFRTSGLPGGPGTIATALTT